MVFLAIYVDDILITGSNEEEIESLKIFLDIQFKIKDLGSLHYFLGIEAIRQSNGILLTQQKYAVDMLAEFNCAKLKSFSSPLPVGIKLHIDDSPPIDDPTMY